MLQITPSLAHHYPSLFAMWQHITFSYILNQTQDNSAWQIQTEHFQFHEPDTRQFGMKLYIVYVICDRLVIENLLFCCHKEYKSRKSWKIHL